MMNSHLISSVFEEINALSEAEFAEELARHKEGAIALAFEEIFLGPPLLEGQYFICSDIYGHRVQLPGLGYDEAFIDAVEEGYAHCQLHGCGHLVVDKTTNQIAFLVTVRLEEDTQISEDALAALSSRYGVPVRAMQVSNCLPAYPLIVAQLDRIEQFGLVLSLVDAITEAAG